MVWGYFLNKWVSLGVLHICNFVQNNFKCAIVGIAFRGAPIATQCFVHFPDKRTLLTLVVYQSVISQYSYSTN